MVDLTKRHDAYFRSSMQNPVIAQDFFQHHLPESVRDALNINTLKLENSSYIDDELQEAISDLVFTCNYNDESNSDDEIDSSEAKIVLLLEHQSTPQQFMAFRVYHYLFNLLNSVLKQRPKEQAKDLLAAVYALVFYHGQQTPYPYSMRLGDCFNDRLGMMQKMFENPVPLIDVNQITDDELKQQALLGIITTALKYSRSQDVGPDLLWIMKKLSSMELDEYLKKTVTKTTLNYMINAGNIANIELFLKEMWQLPEPVRGEFMTAAEQLRDYWAKEDLEKSREEGLEEGLEKGKEEVAINLLENGSDPRFIARITGLELAVILKLKTQLEDKK